MSFLKRNLADTTVGWWIYSVILPLGMIGMGGQAMISQQIRVRGAEIEGRAALCFGIGWLLLGLGAFGFPRYSRAIAGGVSRLNWIRMISGIILGVTSFLVGVFLCV